MKDGNMISSWQLAVSKRGATLRQAQCKLYILNLKP